MKKYVVTILLSLFTSIMMAARTPSIAIYSHGIADTYKQVLAYKDIIPGAWISFNYPDATNSPLRVNYHHTSFGQENEISCLRGAYHTCLKTHTTFKKILFGVSRGGANVMLFAGTHELDDIHAIVVESPYDAMSSVIKHVMKKLRLSALPLSYGERLAEFLFKKYSRYGIRPIDVVSNIPHSVPVLITCSKEDQLVPCESSVALYNALVESGHKHAYLLCLEHGKHAKILSGQDGEKYRSVVHAFYKKYDLPHDPLYAAKGESLLLECQPIPL